MDYYRLGEKEVRDLSTELRFKLTRVVLSHILVKDLQKKPLKIVGERKCGVKNEIEVNYASSSSQNLTFGLVQISRK